MVERYTYDVVPNIDPSLQGIARIKSALEDLNKVRIQPDLSLFINQYKQLVDLKKQLESNTGSSSGNVQALQKQLDLSRQLSEQMKKVNSGANSLGGSGGSGLGGSSLSQVRKDIEATTSGFDSLTKKAKDYRQQLTEIRRMVADQRGLVNRAVGTQQITFEANARYNRNDNMMPRYTDMAGRAQEDLGVEQQYRRDNVSRLRQINSGAGEYGSMSIDDRRAEADKIRLAIDNYDKLIAAQKNYIYTIDHAKQDMDALHTVMQQNSSRVSIDPQRGTVGYFLKNRAGANGNRIAGGVVSTTKQMFSRGISIDTQTGDQALNMSNLTNGGGSIATRNRILDAVNSAGTGFGLQDSQNYYQLAMTRSGFGTNNTAQNSTDMMLAYEQGARSSGASVASYNQYMQTATLGGSGTSGVFTKQDIDELSDALAGENKNSGNSGDIEGNAQAITQVLNQLTTTRALSTREELTATATTGMFSSLGRDFQGQAGRNFNSSINGGFVSASQGKNSQLALMKVMSNPSEYGGVAGYQKALESLEAGTADPSNIAMLRSYTNRFSAQGSAGTAMASRMVAQLFPGVGARESREVVQGLQKGFSNSQIESMIEKDTREGKSTTSRNSSTYASDYQSSLNKINQHLERIEAELGSSAAARGTVAAKNAGNGGNPWIGLGSNILTSMLGDFLQQRLGSLISKGLTKIPGVSGLAGKAMSKFKGFFSNGSKDVVSGTEDAAKDVVSGTEDAAKAAESAGKGGGAFSKLLDSGKGVLSGLSKNGGFWSGLGDAGSKVLSFGSKIAKPLAAITDLFDFATSNNKAKTGGSIAGHWAGAWGGAKAGAALGSYAGPWGTVAGTAIGSISGWFGGDYLGGLLGNKIDGSTSKKKKSSSSKSTSSSKLAIASVTQQYLNDQNEKSNLKKEEDIVKARQKYITDYSNTLSKENTKSSHSSSKGNHASGGFFNTETTIAEGGKGEVAVPLDLAKRDSAQSSVNLLNQLGIRANSNPIPNNTVSIGTQNRGINYSPTININGNTNDPNNLAKVIADTSMKKLMSLATNTYQSQYNIS